MNARLEIHGLTKSYDGAAVVDHVDLVAEAGRITVIVGPNGAGKTTLFNCISGVEPADEGVVRHRGDDVTASTPDALVRRGLARTFQRSALFSTMTVTENLLVAAENRHRRGILRGLLGVPDALRRHSSAMVGAVLAELGLGAIASARVGALSTGTLRLVELARALCTEPDTLLLDEPASGLDDGETGELHHLLHTLAGRGLAVVMVEHDLTLVDETADVVAVMDGGRVVVSGPADEVLRRTDVRDLLFGVQS